MLLSFNKDNKEPLKKSVFENIQAHRATRRASSATRPSSGSGSASRRRSSTASSLRTRWTSCAASSSASRRRSRTDDRRARRDGRHPVPPRLSPDLFRRDGPGRRRQLANTALADVRRGPAVEGRLLDEEGHEVGQLGIGAPPGRSRRGATARTCGRSSRKGASAPPRPGETSTISFMGPAKASSAAEQWGRALGLLARAGRRIGGATRRARGNASSVVSSWRRRRFRRRRSSRGSAPS